MGGVALSAELGFISIIFCTLAIIVLAGPWLLDRSSASESFEETATIAESDQGWTRVLYDPLSSQTWQPPTGWLRVLEGSAGKFSNGHWVVASADNPATQADENDRVVYTYKGGRIANGKIRVKISGFNPPNIFSSGENGHSLSYEYYHLLAGSSKPDLDHHSDVRDQTGWSLPSLPCPGKSLLDEDQCIPLTQAQTDLKLLAYWVKRAGPADYSEEEEVRSNGLPQVGTRFLSSGPRQAEVRLSCAFT